MNNKTVKKGIVIMMITCFRDIGVSSIPVDSVVRIGRDVVIIVVVTIIIGVEGNFHC
jgi:hypothetical protein